MKRNLPKRIVVFQAAFFAGILCGTPYARATGNTFSDIAQNITASIQELPGLLASLSYMFGLLLAALGILRIKDHVENPSQTPLKDGAIRLAAGGALFALPIVSEAMLNTIGVSTNPASSADLYKLDMDTK